MWVKFPHEVTIYFLMGAAFYYLSGDERFSDLLRWFCLVACVILVLLGLFQIGHWLTKISVEIMDEQKRVSLLTPEVLKLEIIASMSPSQIEFARWNTEAVEWDLLPSDQGPVFRLTGSTIPMSFVHDVLENSTPTHVAPMRRYSEGSEERGWYEELLRLMCDRWGIAKRSVGGPKSATWTVSFNRVLWRFGMLEEESA